MPVDIASPWLALVGIVIVVVALVWRRTSRRRRTEQLVSGLRRGGPEERIESAERLIQLGLAPASRVVIPCMSDEQDPSVRAGVALAVARRQWEPGGSRRVAMFRTWAKEELLAQGYRVEQFGPAFARASDLGGPERPTPPEVTSDTTRVEP